MFIPEVRGQPKRAKNANYEHYLVRCKKDLQLYNDGKPDFMFYSMYGAYCYIGGGREVIK